MRLPGGPAWTDQLHRRGGRRLAALPSSGSARFVEEGWRQPWSARSMDRPSREPQARWPGRGSPDRLGLLRSASGPPAMDAKKLADQLVELEVVDAVCDETRAARPQKKRDQAVGWKRAVGASRPEAGRRVRLCDGGCPGGLPPTLREERRPLIRLDEASKRLIGETVQPPAKPSPRGSSGAVSITSMSATARPTCS